MVPYEGIGSEDGQTRPAHAPSEQGVLAEPDAAQPPARTEAKALTRLRVEPTGRLEGRPPVEDVAGCVQRLVPADERTLEGARGVGGKRQALHDIGALVEGGDAGRQPPLIRYAVAVGERQQLAGRLAHPRR